MTEQQQSKQDQPKRLPEQVKADSESQVPTSDKTEPATSPKGAKTGLLWFFVLINFLLIGAAAYGGYWYVNQYTVTQPKLDALQANVTNQLNSQTQEESSQTRTIETLIAGQSTLSEQLLSQNKTLSETDEQLFEQIQGALAQIQELDGRRPTDWLIAEADYLVRMAGRKMWLEQDVRTAIMLLGNADVRLKSLSDPSVLPVRALIAQDIQALQQVNPVSQVSVALALDGLVKQVDNLTIITPKEANDIAPQSVSESTSDWKDNLLAVWRSLVDDFIRVDYRDEPVEPMMTAQQQWISREQIKLALQQAQTAALAGEQTLYEASIARASDIIRKDYVLSAPAVSGFIKALEQLTGTNVSKDIPTKLNAQSALESLLDQRVKRVFGEGANAL